MLRLNILIIFCLHSVLALPRFPFYEKKPTGEVIFDLPQSIQLLIEFAPKITLRTLTKILKIIAAEKAAMEAATEEAPVELMQNFNTIDENIEDHTDKN